MANATPARLGQTATLHFVRCLPVLPFSYINNYFIKKFYPSMYLKDLDQLLTLDFSNTELSPEQKNFCQEFSYDPTENPSETIEKLFKY